MKGKNKEAKMKFDIFVFITAQLIIIISSFQTKKSSASSRNSRLNSNDAYFSGWKAAKRV